MTNNKNHRRKMVCLVAAASVQILLAAGCFQIDGAAIPWGDGIDPHDTETGVFDTETGVFDTETDVIDTETNVLDTESTSDLQVVDCGSPAAHVDNHFALEFFRDDWIDQREYIYGGTVFRHEVSFTNTSLGIVNPLDRVRIALLFRDPFLVHDVIPSSASVYILGTGDGVRMADGLNPAVDAIGTVGGFLLDDLDVKSAESDELNDLRIVLETGGLDPGEMLECVAVEFTVPAEWSETRPFSAGEIPIARVLVATTKPGEHEQDPHPISPTPL